MHTVVIYREVSVGARALREGGFQGYIEVFAECARDSGLYTLPVPIASPTMRAAIEEALEMRNHLGITSVGDGTQPFGRFE
jgi:hypothetical protein